ncbi:transcription repressor OFP16-like [Arachis stenosperma]|uniref:transcription repressor OFP16-like n=1 Tax=Arachis stenosperma TaxID=217475 RepID=UPI0025AB64FB|nr:transcription repressor OFP16-like [Arachis stenosperma]
MPSTKNLRHLNFCFPNSTSKQESPSPPISPIAPSTSPNHIHHQNHNINNHDLPSPSPSSLNMIKNFNSLYDPSLSFNHDHSLRFSSLSTITTTITSSFDFEPEIELEPADFAAAFSSQRFFFSSPGQSNSLVKYNNKNPNSNSSSSSLPFLVNTRQFDDANNDKNNNNNSNKKKKKDVIFNGSVAVPTYSPDPYLDFRQSMQEMVEARPELMDVKSNWNVLHELLLCYLALNPKSTHKFIIGAFADLLVSLMPF